MKKITLILSLVLLAATAGAQTINISNAAEQMNRGYLKKAKDYADKACVHEQTADNPKAWYYRTRIYFLIGDEINKGTKKGNELKAVAPNWLYECKVSALTCKQFDTKGEYVDEINPIIEYIGVEYYNKAYAAYREAHDYATTISYCDTAILLHSIRGKDYINGDYYLAGGAARAMQDNELVKKYYSPLVAKKYDNITVYQILYYIYVGEQDTVNAVKTASSCAKAFSNNYEADMLEAQSYILRGNLEKAQGCMNKALEKAESNDDKANLHTAIGGVYDMAGDFEKAEQHYGESLKIKSSQYMANYSMGVLLFNRGVDKLNTEVDLDDETGLFEQLQQEAETLFRQSLQYFINAVAYIDGLSDAEKAQNRANLHNGLVALRNNYMRLNMVDEFNATNARVQQIEAGN